MITISLCMIVKNEEKVLERCLECVSDIVDEIIIVDTGSVDKTKDIASKFTDKIYDFVWINDFSAARNYAFSKAEMQYIMWLDADDIIYEKDRNELKKLKETLPDTVDVVMMRYNTAFDENGNPVFLYYRERIFKNNSGFLWVGEVHEAIVPKGIIFFSEIAITHKKTEKSYPDRNLKIFEQKLAEGKKLDFRQKFYYGRELYYHKRFDEAIFLFEECINSDRCWIENRLDSCRMCALCYEELGIYSKVITFLLKSFELASPRAEILCEIGRYFFVKEKYEIAIYWYKSALEIPMNEKNGGFVIADCYGFIPCIQLCVCYDKMGDFIKACEYNEKAGKIKPNSEAYLKNKEYFIMKFEKENIKYEL